MPDLRPHLERIAAARIGLPVRRTERLLLRPWREEDRGPLAAMNADPEVAAYLPAPLTRAESDALLDKLRRETARRGFGLWALEDRATREFVGWTGLWVPEWDAEFTPCVEMSWRLARAWWGRGLATEAARDALAYAFDVLRLPEVQAWTVPANVRSWRVMERIGLARVGTFAHPKLPEGHPLRTHVRYAAGSPHARVVAPEPATPAPRLPKVWIDGDGCPRVVKEIAFRAAQRGVVGVTVVANRPLVVPRSPRIDTVVVSRGLDVADDWLVAHAEAGDLVVTGDVPLAAALVAGGVAVLSPRGEWFTPSNVGEKLAMRDFFTEARAAGMIEGGGTAGFDERARRAFANGLDGWIAGKAREGRPA
ncbi:MAG: YaiI/YqxD family protein [Myxococcota bacterium]